MHAVTGDPAIFSKVTPSDRLALTLCVAVILHAMVILGVSFAPEPPARLRAEGLEVTLVTQQSPTPPPEADMLAQANAQGGGNTAQPARPATPASVPLPPQPAELAMPASPSPSQTQTERALPLEPLPLEPLPPTAAPQKETQAAAKPTPAPAVLTKTAPKAEIQESPPQKEQQDSPAEVVSPSPATETSPEITTPTDLPTAQQLITRSFAIASLQAELQEKLETKAQRPRTKFVSANTQEYKYAAYMEAWRAKVERIGNINYPDEARRRKLSGALLLDVALKADGSVIEVIVRRSSGHRVLDDAAVRIVQLAGPYAPFPQEIRREVDVLHITRTWKFLSSEMFQAQ